MREAQESERAIRDIIVKREGDLDGLLFSLFFPLCSLFSFLSFLFPSLFYLYLISLVSLRSFLISPSLLSLLISPSLLFLVSLASLRSSLSCLFSLPSSSSQSTVIPDHVIPDSILSLILGSPRGLFVRSQVFEDDSDCEDDPAQPFPSPLQLESQATDVSVSSVDSLASSVMSLTPSQSSCGRGKRPLSKAERKRLKRGVDPFSQPKEVERPPPLVERKKKVWTLFVCRDVLLC